jgi:hypothetical protein
VSDQVLLDAARKQLAIVVSSGDPLAFLGWWEAWRNQSDISRDDLADLMKDAGMGEFSE